MVAYLLEMSRENSRLLASLGNKGVVSFCVHGGWPQAGHSVARQAPPFLAKAYVALLSVDGPTLATVPVTSPEAPVSWPGTGWTFFKHMLSL